MWYEA
jgi:lysosomal alpha-mannosidase